jgi:hypothetical protein
VPARARKRLGVVTLVMVNRTMMMLMAKATATRALMVSHCVAPVAMLAPTMRPNSNGAPLASGP